MELLQSMDMNKFVIVVPSVLIAMYLIITLQKSLCERNNQYTGLILPVLCFITASVLAFRPLFITQGDGLMLFCLQMWVTFNIPTCVFLFPYLRSRGQKKQLRKAMEAMEAQQAETPAETENKESTL